MLKRLKQIGPGAMVAAAFIGPGTVTTATIAGASYGYVLLWAILFSLCSTIVLQEMSARLGLITQAGVGDALRKRAGSPVIKVMISLIVIIAILIGNAAYEAGNIAGAAIGFQKYTTSFAVDPIPLIIGLLAFLLLYSGKYLLIEKFLMGMVGLMGLIFLQAAIMLKPDLYALIKSLFIPVVPSGSEMIVVGLIGTTVVPYNLFLHASSVKEKWNEADDLATVRMDTMISVGLGGLITMAILVTSAAAFTGSNGSITGLSDLSKQLHPLLGTWSESFIALGFLAAGFTSAVTAPLAAAFASVEILGWNEGLTGSRFRMVWGFVLICGIILSSLGFKPTQVILLAQVANGVLLPFVAIFLLWVMNDEGILGSYKNSRTANGLGILVIAVTLLLGLRSIGGALGLL